MVQDVFELTFSEPILLKLVNFDTVMCFTKTEKVNKFWNQLYLKYFSACTCHLKQSDLNTFHDNLYHCSMSITKQKRRGWTVFYPIFVNTFIAMKFNEPSYSPV